MYMSDDPARTGAGRLSGAITSAAGAAVPNAKVAVKNLATGQSDETLTDSAGHYIVKNLSPGDYELAISAEGYSTNTLKVTVNWIRSLTNTRGQENSASRRYSAISPVA